MKTEHNKTREELVAEIERLRAAVEQLEASNRQLLANEDRVKEALQLAKIGHWDLDLVKNKLHWSDEVFTIFALEPQQFRATYEAFLEYVHPDDRDFVDKAYTDSVKNKEPYNIIHRLLLKDGTIKFVRERCQTFYDQSGKPIRSIGTVQDITEQRQAEEDIKAANNRFIDMLESMSDAFVSLDRNWCYTYMNKKAGKIFNRDPKKMIGKNIWEEFPEGVGQPFHLNYEKAMNKKVFIQMEEYYPPYDKWFENRINPTEDGIAIFFNDITERVKREQDLKAANQQLAVAEQKLSADNQQLQATEQQLRAAVQQLEATNRQLLASEERFKEAEIIAGMGNFTWNIGTGKVTWSNGLHVLLGYDKSEQLDYNKVNADIHHPDDLERITAWLNECIASGKSDFPANEYRLLCKDGKVLHVQTTIKLLYEDDKPFKIIGTVQDITKRKLAEFALREQLHRNEQILQTTLDGYILADSKGIVIDVNPSYCRMVGYSSEELRGMNIKQLEVQLSPEEIKQRIELMLREGGAQFETKHKRKDGQVIDLDVSTVIMMQDEEPLVAAFVRDITERKQAEEALREQEHFISAIINTTPALVYVFDMEKQANVFSSSGLERILDYSRQEIEDFGSDVMEPLIHPDDLARIATFQKQIAAAGDEDVLEIEYRVRHADGSWRFIRSFERPFLRNDDGSLKQKIGVALDVTNRKRVELQNQNIQKRLEEAERIGQIGNWSYEMATGQFIWSNGMYLIYGMDPQKDTIDYEKLLSLSYADDRDRHNAYFERMQNLKPGEQIEDFEYRVIRPNGELRWVDVKFECEFGKNNKPIKFFGTVHDITEKKEAIADSLKYLRLLQESERIAHMGSWEWDIINDRVLWSDEVFKILGLDPEKTVLDKETSMKQIHPDDIEYANRTLQEALDKKQQWLIENRVVLPDGSIKTVLSRGKAEYDDNGQPVRMFGGLQDITERKQVENSYIEAKSNLQALLDNREDSIWSLDRDYNYVVFNKPYADVIFQELGVRIKKGMNALEIHPKEIREFWKSKFDTAFNGEYVTFEFSHTLDGKELFFQVFMNPITSGEEVTGVSCLSMNITERKEAEIKLEKYQQHLEELVKERTAKLESANQELESFAYSVSHDLKAPLRAIGGFSKMLMDKHADRLDAEGMRLLNVVRDNTKKMNNLINDILELSRLGRSEIRTSPLDMKDLVQTVFYEITNEDSRKRINLEIGDLGKIQGDRHMLKQVWINLLSNALKFSSNEQKSLISVTSKIEKDKSVYCIKDNGVGFDEHYKSKLFDVFQRLHRADEFEGTGVGLAIVKRIINRHGGEVWAESKLGEGATFYFSLPDQNQLLFFSRETRRWKSQSDKQKM